MGRIKGIYERLAKTRFAMKSLSSLWLAPDHLLFVENDGYTENYKRFYLRDIEAFICRETAKWHVWTVLFLGILTLSLVGLFYAFTQGEIVSQSITGFLAVFFIVCVFANLALGPSCACLVQTAVQRERLRTITRMKQAMKILDRLGAAVTAVQGELTGEVLEQSYALLADGPEDVQRSAATSRAPGLAAIHPTRMYKGYVHEVLIGALFAHLCAACIRALATGVLPLVANAIVWPVLIGVPFLAAVRQYKTILPGGLKVITWLTILYCAFQGIVAIFSQTLYALVHSNEVHPGNLFEYAFLICGTPAWDSREVGFRVTVAILYSAITGTIGLILLRRFRKATSAPPPLPAAAA